MLILASIMRRDRTDRTARTDRMDRTDRTDRRDCRDWRGWRGLRSEGSEGSERGILGQWRVARHAHAADDVARLMTWLGTGPLSGQLSAGLMMFAFAYVLIAQQASAFGSARGAGTRIAQRAVEAGRPVG